MQITKRDYFAAQALTGLLARSNAEAEGRDPYEQAASEAFLYADAMLKLSKTLMDPVEIDPEEFAKKTAEEHEP